MSGSRESASRSVTGMSGRASNPRELLERILPSGTLASSLDRARQYADRIAATGITVSRGLRAERRARPRPSAWFAPSSPRKPRRCRAGARCIVADQAVASLRKAREGYKELVQEANEGFEAGMDRLFLAAGYSKGAGKYAREGIVGSTVLSGVVREHQEVAGYRPFPVPGFEARADLSDEGLSGLSAEGIQARLSAALGGA